MSSLVLVVIPVSLCWLVALLLGSPFTSGKDSPRAASLRRIVIVGATSLLVVMTIGAASVDRAAFAERVREQLGEAEGARADADARLQAATLDAAVVHEEADRLLMRLQELEWDLQRAKPILTVLELRARWDWPRHLKVELTAHWSSGGELEPIFVGRLLPLEASSRVLLPISEPTSSSARLLTCLRFSLPEGRDYLAGLPVLEASALRESEREEYVGELGVPLLSEGPTRLLWGLPPLIR